jgi:menaquinone-dependent protoporphyrinogen oxidase
MSKKIIIYTTKYGFVTKVATTLKAKLGGEVELVNLMKAQAPSLQDYDTVILGGSIYFGKVQKKLAAYVRDAMPELAGKKVGLFVCAGVPDPETKRKELEQAFPPELMKQAVCKDILGDEIVYEKLSFLDKFITRRISGSTAGQSHFEENRIEAFAQALR